jgi:hypothetical protein
MVDSCYRIVADARNEGMEGSVDGPVELSASLSSGVAANQSDWLASGSSSSADGNCDCSCCTMDCLPAL